MPCPILLALCSMLLLPILPAELVQEHHLQPEHIILVQSRYGHEVWNPTHMRVQEHHQSRYGYEVWNHTHM